MPSEVLHVVSGVAVNERGEIFMARRKLTGVRPGLWELPGGKVEASEGAAIALAREWKEELAVAIEVKPRRISSSIMRVERLIKIDLYEVNLVCLTVAQTPIALDHDELGWFDPTVAVKSMPCSPGYYFHFDDLRAYLMETGRWLI